MEMDNGKQTFNKWLDNLITQNKIIIQSQGGTTKMDIEKFTKQQGTFLTAEEVSKNPTGVFIPTAEGEMVMNKFGNERLHLPGEFAGGNFVFDLSKTNAREVKEQYGNDTNQWIGKKIYLEIYKTRTTDGNMTDAIAVKKQNLQPRLVTPTN